MRRIAALWGASTAIIAVSLIGSAFFQAKAENTASQAVNTAAFHTPKNTTQSSIAAQELGKNIIALAYHQPSLYVGNVLGDSTPAPLKEEEIADISTPTVMRIFNKVDGTISFPEFDIDLINFKFNPNGHTYSEKANSLVSGTGFFVDDKGHILTNSHVVDKKSVLDNFTAGVIAYYNKVLTQQITNMSNSDRNLLEQALLSRYGNDPATAAIMLATELDLNISEYIKEKSTINAKQTISVLNPKDQGTEIKTEKDLEALIGKGIEAKVIDWHPDYEKTYKDVALIQIDGNTTPFLTLDDKSKISTGQQIYIIGFPSNADISNSDLFDRTMTQGSVNSVKKIADTDVYQTDAKISLGSSGSPMLNDKGEVVGIISFLNNGSVGDNFAYAVPISHAVELMKNNSVTVSDNPYMTKFTAGLALAQQNLCRKANLEYAQVQDSNQTFANQNLQKYIDKCNDVIAAGNSKEGLTYRLSDWFKKMPPYAWFGGAAFVIISLIAFFAIRHFKKPTLTVEPVMS